MANILSIFSKSPFKPINQHMKEVYCASENLLPFFESVLVQDWRKANEIRLQINKYESYADNLKDEIRMHVPSSLFLPVSRSDLLTLLLTQEQIANLSRDICGIVIGRKMKLPKDIHLLFMQYLKSTLATVDQANIISSLFVEVTESSFRHDLIEDIKKKMEILDQAESKTDYEQIEVRQKLFDLEKDLPPVDVVFLYQIIEWIGQLADKSQGVGHIVMLLLAN